MGKQIRWKSSLKTIFLLAFLVFSFSLYSNENSTIKNERSDSCDVDFTFQRCDTNCFIFAGNTIDDVNVVGWEWVINQQDTLSGETTDYLFEGFSSNNVELNIITDIGCYDTVFKTIKTDSCMLGYSGTFVNPTCNSMCNGSVEIIPNGGLAPYSISFDGNAYDADTLELDNLCGGVHNLFFTDSLNCVYEGNIDLAEPEQLTFTYETTPVSCHGICTAKIDFEVSGGSPPYSYYVNELNDFYSDPISHLCPGIYNVIITDSNLCSDSVEIDLTEEPEEIEIVDVVIENVSCFLECDGSCSVNAQGGVPPYNFFWSNDSLSNGIDSLCQGTYFVTVFDANNCQKSRPVIVNQPGPIFINLHEEDLLCNGVCEGKIVADVWGGTYPYFYSWNNGETTDSIWNLCAGNYKLTITDGNGCVNTAIDSISEPEAMIGTIDTITHCFCKGACEGTMQFSVTGGQEPFSYVWSTGDSTLFADSICAGLHDVLILDSNLCEFPIDFEITEPSLLTGYVNYSNTSHHSVCDGESDITASGGTPPYSYFWSTNSFDSEIVNLCPDIYYITVTDSFGCVYFDSVLIQHPPIFSIEGNVFTKSNVLPVGKAILYEVNASQQYLPFEITDIIDGYYQFDSLHEMNYCVMAVPYFPQELQVPIYLPTYLGNNSTWQNSANIYLTDSVLSADIYLNYYDEILYGDNELSGDLSYVDSSVYDVVKLGAEWYDINYQITDNPIENPARNIPVFLAEKTGELLDFCLTDSLGKFNFTHMPDGEYVIHIEKAGHVSEKDTFNLQSDEDPPNYLSFSIVEDEVILLGSSLNFQYQELIHVYPNPCSEVLAIELPDELKDAIVKIYSVQGKLVLEREMELGFSTINMSELQSGAYFLVIEKQNKKYIQKIIKE
jgi:hypothetical protein